MAISMYIALQHAHTLPQILKEGNSNLQYFEIGNL